MKEEIDYAKRILQRLPVIVKGLKAQQEQIEDDYTEFHVDPFNKNSETKDTLKELEFLDREIARYSKQYENAVAFLEDHGEDPFKQSWFQRLKTKSELARMFSDISILQPKTVFEKVLYRIVSKK